MREIVLDTETTGLDPRAGHRIIEIGCVELVNHMPSGRHFHHYIDPERDIPAEAVAVHGITADKLKGKPVFAEIAGEFVDFIADATLVIHNAEFDVGFLNAELGNLGFPPISRGRVVDTLTMTRRKLPGQAASLDALCQRFGIDNSKRTFHGALLDAELLAEVYLELIGGRQASIDLVAGPAAAEQRAQRRHRQARPHAPGADELALHDALMARIRNPIWKAAD
ncbi:MAG: DNA polymerase III subunit epsilon [Alphaproteobacteria bacterium]|jgi:DNA polymerase-3 subunit epsilon